MKILKFLIIAFSIGSAVACDVDGIALCLSKLNGGFTPDAFEPSILLQSCKKFHEVKECTDRYVPYCDQKHLTSVRMTVGFMSYFCSPTFKKVLKQAETCIPRIYNPMMAKCKIGNMAHGCSSAKKVMNCVDDYLKRSCTNPNVAVAYHNIITKLVKLQHEEIIKKTCDVEFLPFTDSNVKTDTHRVSSEKHFSSVPTKGYSPKGSAVSCDKAGISLCLSKLESGFTREGFKPSILLQSCKKFHEVKECTDRYVPYCDQKRLTSVRMSVGFMEYYCSPTFKKVLKQAETCIPSIYNPMMAKCKIGNTAHSCSSAKKIVICVDDYLKRSCTNPNVAVAYHNIITKLVKLQNEEIFKKTCDVEFLPFADSNVKTGTGGSFQYNIEGGASSIVNVDDIKVKTFHRKSPRTNNDKPHDWKPVYVEDNYYRVGHIIGICFGVGVFVVFAVVLGVFVVRRRRHRHHIIHHSLMHNESLFQS